MSWSIPKKYGYGRGGEDYAEFVWNYRRCYQTPFARNEALRAYRRAQDRVNLLGSTNTTVFGRC